jgi:hypothetical protein
VRELVGYLRFDTDAELHLLNEIWGIDRVYTNYLLAQQKLVSKQRQGAKVSKRYDRGDHPIQTCERLGRRHEGLSNNHGQDDGRHPPRGALQTDPGPHRQARAPGTLQGSSPGQTHGEQGLQLVELGGGFT